MCRVRQLLLLFVLSALPGQLADAGHPSYLILRTPASPTPPHAPYARYPGQGLTVAAPSYAYGWFGAHPHPQWSRQFGYYRNYTQWSRK
ncbi:MAG: hypothetical protein AB7F89_01360 [Pirellulaceae bacterium]